MNEKTDLILNNRNELIKNKNMISIKNHVQTKDIYVNRINLISKKNNTQSKFIINEKIIMILKEKIKSIDPWYAKICKLTILPKNVQQLAINTTFKNTLEYWYIYLIHQKTYLMKHNTWMILKQELRKITNKKIQLIIKKNKLNTLTPYEWFYKIHKEKILEEYALLKKDSNIQILEKFFNTKFEKTY